VIEAYYTNYTVQNVLSQPQVLILRQSIFG